MQISEGLGVSYADLSDILEEIPAGICRFCIDENLTILNANERFYELFGFKKADALRNGFNSMFFLMNEEEKMRVRDHLDRLLKGELPPKGEYELSLRCPDGNNVVVLTRYNYPGVSCRWMTVNVIDITDRKRIEEELRIGEKRYRLALNQSGKVFFFFDVETRTMHLSDELAHGFGLPNVVDNMPNNPLALSLVEPESIDVYKDFYTRIIAGEEFGSAIISCHTRLEPDNVLWYKIAFTSVFNSEHLPASTIITYEAYTEQYRSEIENIWQQANIKSSANGDFYLSIDYDLTRGIRLREIGEMSVLLDKSGRGYDVIFLPIQYGIVAEEDCDTYRTLFDRDRLLAMFAEGICEDQIECRMLRQRGEPPGWVLVTVQLIRDPYSGHVLSRSVFKDIDGEKTEQLLSEEKMEELKMKLEANRAKAMINQMQPHFLYNALSAIRTIIRRDPEKAYNLLYDFTVHLRSSIKAISSDELIPFIDELKNIKAYLNIEKMRFEDGLDVIYEVDCVNFKVIPLSIQPLAENAARHGIYYKGSEGGTITIGSYEAADSYVVEVKDNGCGFDVNEALEKENSYGLKNLIFRLKTLMHAKVDIHSQIGQGTLIRVFFPKDGKVE